MPVIIGAISTRSGTMPVRCSTVARDGRDGGMERRAIADIERDPARLGLVRDGADRTFTATG